MIERVSERAVLLWQTVKEEAVGEPAILIKRYEDVLELQQEKRTILISLEIVDEFKRAINEAMKKEKP